MDKLRRIWFLTLIFTQLFISCTYSASLRSKRSTDDDAEEAAHDQKEVENVVEKSSDESSSSMEGSSEDMGIETKAIEGKNAEEEETSQDENTTDAETETEISPDAEPLSLGTDLMETDQEKKNSKEQSANAEESSSLEVNRQGGIISTEEDPTVGTLSNEASKELQEVVQSERVLGNNNQELTSKTNKGKDGKTQEESSIRTSRSASQRSDSVPEGEDVHDEKNESQNTNTNTHKSDESSEEDSVDDGDLTDGEVENNMTEDETDMQRSGATENTNDQTLKTHNAENDNDAAAAAAKENPAESNGDLSSVNNMECRPDSANTSPAKTSEEKSDA